MSTIVIADKGILEEAHSVDALSRVENLLDRVL